MHKSEVPQTPFRVLQVLTAMNRGGAETMVMNHYRAIDRNKVQFDFLVHRQQRADYDDEIEALGGRIFRAMPIRPWSYPAYFRWLDGFFREHRGEFTAVHGHIQENSGFALRYAKKYGIKNLIASSHIADLGVDYKFIFRQFGKIWTNRFATQRLACGKDAGRFLYGKRDFQLLNNAIDAARYQFNPSTREEKRKELGIPADALVIGNVARFYPQKNHSFIIKVFAEVVKVYPSARLLLVGSGPLMDETATLAARSGISDNVIFAGLRPDVPDLLQAFDVFFMPSVFEGLPVSVIEAQAAGLPCLLSDVIDRETDITGNVRFMSLGSDIGEWAKAIVETYNMHPQRRTQLPVIQNAGYDVVENINRLYKLYLCDT